MTRSALSRLIEGDLQSVIAVLRHEAFRHLSDLGITTHLNLPH